VSPSFVAQAANDAWSFLVFLVGIGLLALQLYLIYAIIATRHDVRFIRERLVFSAVQEEGRSAPRGPALHWVVLRSAGSSPRDVEDVLIRRAGYARSGARGAVRNPGQRIASSGDYERVRSIGAALQDAGATVEIVSVDG
jgi:hypothetical protein